MRTYELVLHLGTSWKLDGGRKQLGSKLWQISNQQFSQTKILQGQVPSITALWCCVFFLSYFYVFCYLTFSWPVCLFWAVLYYTIHCILIYLCNNGRSYKLKYSFYLGVYIYNHRGVTICDVIKQNELELANTNYKIKPNKADSFFVSYCFCNLSTFCIFGTNCPISEGFSPT